MTTYRNEPFANLMIIVSFVFGAGGIVLAIWREDGSLIERAAPAVAMVAMSTFVFFRLARAGVYADDDGIRVVNPLRTERLPWEHLVRFTFKAYKGFPGIGLAELIDGRRVELWGIQARSPNEGAKRVPRQLVDDLNERLRVQRTREPASPPPADP